MSTEASPVPGERIASYDITARQDSDYYAVFADIPEADRAAWDRAKAYIDEVGPQMADAWDRAEYPLDAARRMGEMDLVVDGIEHPALTHLSPLAAGLVNMEISRGDGSLGTVLAVQGRVPQRPLPRVGSPAPPGRGGALGPPPGGPGGCQTPRAPARASDQVSTRLVKVRVAAHVSRTVPPTMASRNAQTGMCGMSGVSALRSPSLT